MENMRTSSATGGITYSVHKPLVRNGKIPSARGGCSVVYVRKSYIELLILRNFNLCFFWVLRLTENLSCLVGITLQGM